mmetsp:Transcript_8954/g.23311  ORF Transcript_8954/g.23311 Transcript_8954/m.23311 type:complete len:229 (-) Transcript_8954:1153-1839(-)
MSNALPCLGPLGTGEGLRRLRLLFWFCMAFSSSHDGGCRFGASRTSSASSSMPNASRTVRARSGPWRTSEPADEPVAPSPGIAPIMDSSAALRAESSLSLKCWTAVDSILSFIARCSCSNWSRNCCRRSSCSAFRLSCSSSSCWQRRNSSRSFSCLSFSSLASFSLSACSCSKRCFNSSSSFSSCCRRRSSSSCSCCRCFTNLSTCSCQLSGGGSSAALEAAAGSSGS